MDRATWLRLHSIAEIDQMRAIARDVLKERMSTEELNLILQLDPATTDVEMFRERLNALPEHLLRFVQWMVDLTLFQMLIDAIDWEKP